MCYMNLMKTTSVLAIAALLTLVVGCGETPTETPTSTEQAQRALDDVNHQLDYLAPSDETAATRFAVIRDKVNAADASLEATRAEIAALEAEIEALRNPAAVPPPTEQEKANSHELWERVQFWKEKAAPMPAPLPEPTQELAPPVPEETKSAWAFWK